MRFINSILNFFVHKPKAFACKVAHVAVVYLVPHEWYDDCKVSSQLLGRKVYPTCVMKLLYSRCSSISLPFICGPLWPVAMAAKFTGAIGPEAQEG